MPKTKKIMMRIFYFNITYGCNSNCVFCYSHNTMHNKKTCNEISSEAFFNYLDEYNLNSKDRVIINGGEPFLHSEIDDILKGLLSYECEVLIYTNGRLVKNFSFEYMTEKYRFVIPIHGYEEVHDKITGVPGSYAETIQSLEYLTEKSKCKVDVKIIINNYMINQDPSKSKFEASLANIHFNNAVHITKMADTIVSKRNGCSSVTNATAAEYTEWLFEYYKNKGVSIKLFDTCVKAINWENYGEPKPYGDEVTVYFKDKNQFREMVLRRKIPECMAECSCKLKCVSAVDEYKVIEYIDGKVIENLE
ncbi:radical SAM protein [Roseburia sp. 831b]|uniref:radical SAM protein n=1 Tax=Roseburia sp. 831b TaxID=1261635 RepID=UPI000952B834|nr:radical SAM protein [Roseburia sp. 831b]WVK74181.1 radical SAM protein [Roseburia sp. 831b]